MADIEPVALLEMSPTVGIPQVYFALIEFIQILIILIEDVMVLKSD